jgi:hypothetical protein
MQVVFYPYPRWVVRQLAEIGHTAQLVHPILNCPADHPLFHVFTFQDLGKAIFKELSPGTNSPLHPS